MFGFSSVWIDDIVAMKVRGVVVDSGIEELEIFPSTCCSLKEFSGDGEGLRETLLVTLSVNVILRGYIRS
jgi:hypothetical protein